MPTSFQESDLEFTFSDNWMVKAFDDHPFYKSLAGQGLKGVDFVGILNHETVVLIEVKNYKIRFPTALPPIHNKITGNHPAIVATMQRKAQDTQRVLRVIRKYYQRRWWLKPLQFLVKKLPLRFQLQIEWQFWLCLEAKVAQGNYLLVLWMELEDEYDFFNKKEIQQARAVVQQQLQQLEDVPMQVLLLDSCHPFILDEKIEVR